MKSPPPPGLGPAGKIIYLISEITGYGAVLAIIGSLLIITYEVMARYVFGWPTVWEIEAAVFLLIFATFVGSAFALKYDGHISMDMVVIRLQPKTRAKLEIGTSIAALAFCVLVSIRGWEIWWEAFSEGWYSDSLWAPPLWIPYLFLPLGFTCICLQYGVIIVTKMGMLKTKG
jgi:TRAP-type C4-dicarboxylate transport system permease small subunit